jgi:methylated-DNA-protein-cysteine methyltransferase related protein
MLFYLHTMKLKTKNIGPTFSERVVKLACSIPKGRVTTYGRITRACGAGPMASQSITAILGKAYESGITDIPFHRIVYADGHVWINEKYAAKRRSLYKKEGIILNKNDKIVDFEDKLLEFK